MYCTENIHTHSNVDVLYAWCYYIVLLHSMSATHAIEWHGSTSTEIFVS